MAIRDPDAGDEGPAAARARRRVAFANYAAKVALVALLVHAVAFPELPQYAGKGIGTRLLTYPLGGLVVAGVWFALGRRRAGLPYPHLIDLCAIAPFLIDTAGNAANLYDTVSWWDDVMHFVTWVPWVTAFGLAMRYLQLGRLNVAALTVGFGAVTHILWEIGEYFAFIGKNPNEYESAYTDTLGDLAASLAGSFAGAVLVATVLWRLGTVRADQQLG